MTGVHPAGDVVVIGGGVAGTSAAIELAAAGWGTTLLESRPRLGGAAYSFRRHGLVVDTGQHVALRCYTRYRSLLERMGVADRLVVQSHMDVPVIWPGRPTQHLRSVGGLPAPLHLLPALVGYRALGPRETLAAAHAMAALRRLDPDDPRLDEQTLGSWLRAHGQSDRAITALWELMSTPALNLPADDASLALAVRVFRTGLLERADAGDIAIPSVPLGDLHDAAARRHLDHIGVTCITRQRVRGVRRVDEKVVVATDTDEVAADAAVLAVPPTAAAGLAPDSACADRASWIELGASPIVSAHVRYDRPVTRWAFAAVLDSAVPWLFDRTAASGCDGQYLAIPFSAAKDMLPCPSAELTSMVRDELARIFPDARHARTLDAFVTREPTATFAQHAGTARLRPGAGTRDPGIVLAGAWTDTGWPDTLEGAVRSGVTAAGLLGRQRTGEGRRAGARPVGHVEERSRT